MNSKLRQEVSSGNVEVKKYQRVAQEVRESAVSFSLLSDLLEGVGTDMNGISGYDAA